MKIRLLGEFREKFLNNDGDMVLLFKVSDLPSRKEAENFKQGQRYTINASVPKSTRSNQQNRMMWALIGEICEKINGCRSDAEEMNIYCQILQETGAKCDLFQCTEEAYAAFKKQFRYCTVLEERDGKKGKTLIVKAYFGTSQMNTEEMSKVIDRTIQYAEEVGINTEYWREVLG